jgi:hypothetical protein
MNRYQILRGEKLPYVKPEIRVKPWVQDIPYIEINPQIELVPAGYVGTEGLGWSMIETVGTGFFNPTARVDEE